ncbi:hypothetical protein PR003_g11381 [Phytophthora rubi]|uniref:MtN3-like protein n=1 Tax=Phytophthora rubi TaxID=129364 RepID=A0A6A3MNP1_9STRA|nr:hypothetical protein PR001_g11071 [Phytophthora rubi]KAE9338702.1 hypothetical protein PR003_g11381 [Phytophthora rubi]
MHVVDVLSALTSLTLIYSPVIATFHIFRRKSVGVASIVPLATLLANSHMWMLYGYVIRNWFPVFWVFLFGDAAGLVYRQRRRNPTDTNIRQTKSCITSPANQI